MEIPFLNLGFTHKQIQSELSAAFQNVVESNGYILSRNLETFESDYAAFNGVNYCVGVSNGLDSLHLALKSLSIGPGDEVIVPSNTYIATLLAVTCAGAKPVLAEPDWLTYNIDPKNVERALTGKTRAIIAVHLYGQACDMVTIMALANKHHLLIIEDNAQAHGASFNNKLTGSWDHANGTSF